MTLRDDGPWAVTLGALALILLGTAASLLRCRRRAQRPVGKGKMAGIALMSSQEAPKSSAWYASAAPAAAPAAAPTPAPELQLPASGMGAATWLDRTPVVPKGEGDTASTSDMTTAVTTASAPQVSSPQVYKVSTPQVSTPQVSTPQVSAPRRGRVSVGSALFHFIDDSGEQQPAVPGSQLKQWLAQGVVTEDTYVWADDARTPDWAPLWKTSALFAYCEKTAEGAGTPGSITRVNRLHTSHI